MLRIVELNLPSLAINKIILINNKWFLGLLFLFLQINSNAQLVFQSLEHDYGKVSKAKSLMSEFVITNTGTEDAVILRMDASGSFAFKLDQITIKPGKSDTVKLFLDPHMQVNSMRKFLFFLVPKINLSFSKSKENLQS